MKIDFHHKIITHKGSLPALNLRKHKKYDRPHNNPRKPLEHDLDNIILRLTPSPSSQNILQQPQIQQKFNNKGSAWSPCLHWREIKQLRVEISKYIDKMGKVHSGGDGDYTEFVRLSRESQDYLEYYIRNHFKQSEPTEAIACTDKAVILSLLKNNYPCLTKNPPEIVNRILLSFSINPLNDFHLIPWTTFANFRKLATFKQSKTQNRLFLASYLMGGNKSIGGNEFWSILGGILRKLKEVISQGNVQRLLQRVMEVGEWIGVEMSREQLQGLMGTYWYFIWEQIVRLIFIV